MGVTITEPTTAELAVEVAELRRPVVAMREELDRRDVEQVELESVVEFLLEEHRDHLYVLGAVVLRVLGDIPYQNGGGDDLLNALYRGRLHEAGFRQGRYVTYSRPARRWQQRGRKQELLDLAAKHGVKVSRRDSREWIIRKLWSHLPLRDEMPGCVGPFE